MKREIEQWRHVFKLDPDRHISDADLARICQSGTDAIIVGGSSGVTFENTVDLLSRIRRFAVPCALEISNLESIVLGFDLYFVPLILNTHNTRWLTQLHHEAIKIFGSKMPWHLIAAEGYIVLNADSTVAKLTEAQTSLANDDVLAYATMGEKLFHLPIVYLEYSGMFGDMSLVANVAKTLDKARLFYGGGIDSLEKAQQAAAVADTIVVGNALYENLNEALKTVRAVKSVEM